MLAAVILSGGSSSHMGSPKALLAYQGRPFLEHLLEVTVHPKIGVRRVVLGAHAEPIAKQAAIRSLPAAAGKPDFKDGAPRGTDGLLLCLIDHPLISSALVHDLI